VNYESETIASVLGKLNREYFLPTLQREFVWDSKRICRLFDSLMRGYPISSFLLWKVPENARGDLEIYRFLDSASELGKHNDRVRAFGVTDLTFVLDGQQRLTSLSVGLRGTYEARKKYARSGDRSVIQKLCLDLLKDGNKGDDVSEPSYGFAFRDESSGNLDRKSYWFELGRILDYPEDNHLEQLIRVTAEQVQAVRSISSDQNELVIRHLTRLHAVVFHERSIFHYTETNGDQRRMLDIFVRANSGGKPLSKPDLLLSNLTVHWQHLNARDEIKRSVDDLNAALNAGCRSAEQLFIRTSF
jgi:hypothetical protein